jgi:pterin-4a-carbinolamine dehydratase
VNVFSILRKLLIAIIVGILWFPDDEDLKPERIQFWESNLSDGWKREGDGVALLRTFVEDDRLAADELAGNLAGELAKHGYKADELEVVGNVVSVRLCTASVGRLTERDYAAALLIDLTL